MTRVGPTAVILTAVLLLAACEGGGLESSDRQRLVAERGAEVMPFDLDATTHRFEKTDDGMVQVVVADDPADRSQVEKIREHLLEEARRFGEGDFSDPRAIHGDGMPGVEELSRRAHQIDIRYRSVPAGAEIVFRTSSQVLVTALHAWASAQVEDHGQHADHG